MKRITPYYSNKSDSLSVPYASLSKMGIHRTANALNFSFFKQGICQFSVGHTQLYDIEVVNVKHQSNLVVT